MKWTSEKPTIPGFYWHRVKGEAVVCCIHADLDVLYVWWCGEQREYALNTVNGEWYGPLRAPE